MGAIITLKSSGNFSKTYGFLKAIKNKRIYDVLDEYGRQGVAILKANTPVRTGKTADSWFYKKEVTDESVCLEWHNNNLCNDGKTPIVILIIKGHGTRTGGYVAPNDFINTSMVSLFEEATEAVWKVVTSL